MQQQLDIASADYYTALDAQEEAQAKMDECQGRIDEANEQITALQGQLSERARSMYRSGSTTFVSASTLRTCRLPEEAPASREARADPGTPAPAPRDAREWARWMDAGRKPSPEILFLEMQGWARDFAGRGDYMRASELDTLIRIMEQRRLPVSMIQDAAFAVLKEGVPYEKILGGLW